MQHSNDRRSRTGSLVFVALICWFSTVFGLGLAGALEDPPRPLIPLALMSMAGASWIASRRVESLRRWLLALDVRALVAVHVVRLPIGMWFLHAYADGRLPGELALLAGWGDIATGALAIATLPFDEHTRWGRRIVAVFNTLGLVDILMVVVTAQKVLLFGAGKDLPIGYPFVLLPMFVVPLVIVTHAWTFVRVARAARHQDAPIGAAVAAQGA